MTELRTKFEEENRVYIQQIQHFTEITYIYPAFLTATTRECGKCLYVLGRVSITWETKE